MPAGRRADAVAPRTFLHGDSYRHRPNGLETLKHNTSLVREQVGTFYPAIVRIDVLTKTLEPGLWKERT